MVTGSNSGWELCGSACQRGYRVGGGLGTLVVPKRELGGRGGRGGFAAISHCLLTSGGLRPAVWGPPDRP